MRSTWAPNASFGVLVIPMLVQGVALSTFFVSMVAIQLRDVPPAQTPAASGLSNFARITCGGFAASLTTAFWDRREAFHQTVLADAQTTHLDAWRQALGALRAGGLTAQQATGALAQQVTSQASTLGAVELFWLFGLVSLVMVPVTWLARRSFAGGGTAAAD
jgi:DHA2 family multidrug resistance protein